MKRWWWLLGLAGLAVIGCDGEEPERGDPDASLPQQMPADDPQSCVSCHPRQVMEWAGSSHNYGAGLDGTFQALELTANYYAMHALGRPLFRQNQLCIACHAPSLGIFDQDGVFDMNATIREGAVGRLEQYGREVAFPGDDVDLVMPAGRAIEVADAVAAERAQAEGRDHQRLLSFQGISCDSCHKVGRPYEDRMQDPGHSGLTGCEEGESEEACIERQYAACEDGFDPRCVRRSRGQHPHDPPFFDDHVATAALPVERNGSTRYGPFGEGDVAPATAHEVSSGATEYARNFDLARYPNGEDFPNQPRDVRPFIKSSHFCGTCHDVRFPPLTEKATGLGIDLIEFSNQGLTPDDPNFQHPRNTNLEPAHNEPFLRLENLYTEWFISPLNLHPATQGDSDDPRFQFPDNPYRHADGSARRVVCQDCHMSLYPFAPPGAFPGAYTHPDNCDDTGDCGLKAAEAGAKADLRIHNRERITTHNMTGVDVALGQLFPVDSVLQQVSTALPFQKGDDLDPVYGLPQALDTRRERNLKTTVSLSLAGTPQVLQRGDPNNCHDGACNLPVKVWITNVNGGHNVAAGFSQERQIWVEFTIQDLGKPLANGMYSVVDCELADIDDLYTQERLDEDGYPVWHETPRKLTQAEANDLVDRLTGIAPGLDSHFHERICRGLSGHLIDKPHDETHEPEADGRLDDEDILLHRIGNTVPTFEDGTQLVSWHIADLGFDTNYFDLPLPPDRCEAQYAGQIGEIDSVRVARPDQFHIPGLNPFACQLTEDHLDPKLTGLDNLVANRLDGSVVKLSELGELKASVVTTPDERLEILYPFPEYPPLLPHYDDEGHFHFGERFGLVYLTNIFYQTCNCSEGDCEGPEELEVAFGHINDHEGKPLPRASYDASGTKIGEGTGPTELHAQVPWLKSYPALPHVDSNSNHHPLDSGDHTTPGPYRDLLAELGKTDPKIWGEECSKADLAPGERCGTTYKEAFTFIPLNSDHMPNNRSLKFYKAQRHYYDIRVPDDAVGPLRVTARAWYRHFPPEFLRLMARFMDGAYRRACAEGIAEEYFPHGPLVVEGPEMTERFPNAANIDKLRRFILDQAVFEVDIETPREPPANPTWARDVAPIIRDNCTPCHSDVLRHGGLILEYDAYDAYDYPKGQPDPNPARDPILNLVNVAATFDGKGRPMVVPGDADASLLMDLLTKDAAALRNDGIISRPMPLKTDGLAPREIETIRRWIDQGAN